MKRKDLVAGAVFKPKDVVGSRVYELRHELIISYLPGLRQATLIHEGTLRQTDNEKGFTVTSTIMGNEVGVFLRFEDFDLIYSPIQP